ncbi:hypothetical protein PIROE2DRAFT_19717 [Piromyces sp. E2]|nr:hypothetical protein PIROE2DRAFT_19717 [Piromyces sp. E2]|eukprot:OUM69173.1 hypothetical protein PIROE2DRAFT_19717 [Piromyces sp. E2]
MKISNILLSAALVFNYAKARVINTENSNDVIENNNKESNNVIENKNFKNEYHCINDVNGICDAILGEINVALNDLSSTFEFKQQVVFESYIFNATDIMPQYSNLVALATDINFVSLKSSNDLNTPPYIYTQALAKQLNINREINLKKNDFVIIFNTDIIDKLLTFVPNYNLSTTILHEIIHVLNNFNAIPPSAASSEDEIKKYFAESSFMPSTVLSIDSNVIDNATSIMDLLNIKQEITSFYPLSIYQKYLIDLNTNEKIFKDLGFLHEIFNKCIESYGNVELKDISAIITNCVNKFDTETKNSIRNVAVNYYIKPESMGFLSNDNSILGVQTFDGKFITSSSVFHSDYKYFNEMDKKRINGNLPPEYGNITEENAREKLDENFLMYFDTIMLSRESLLKTVAKDNKHGLIGPNIVSALKTMGWTEKGEKSSDDLYYVDSDNYPEQCETKLNFKVYSLFTEMNSMQGPIVEPPVDIPSVEPPVETQSVDPNDSDSNNEDDIPDLNTVEVEEEIDSDEDSN